MLKLSSVTISQGGSELIRDIDLILHPGQHLGLVGTNGCGKSSLLSAIQGDLAIEQGTLTKAPGTRIASMKQEFTKQDLKLCAIDFAISGDQTYQSLQNSLQAAQDQSNEIEIGKIHSQLEDIQGYTIQYRAERLLSGLGFHPSQFRFAVQDFSGGWRMRLQLAKALMCPADLLLLDEPTNHLDLDAVLFLEDWLQQYPGTLILISHDRDFLDAIVRHIAAIENQQLRLYNGHYSSFEAQRAAHMLQLQAQAEKIERQRKHMQAFVDRFRYKASKAKQAQSRLKAIEKLPHLQAAYATSPFNFHIEPAEKTSSPLVLIKNSDIGYDTQQTILKNISFSVDPESRIGLLGLNGTGKSTLLKALAQELPIQQGELITGEHLKVGYFAQHQVEAIDFQQTPLRLLQQTNPTASEQQIRNFLGGFAFHGDKAVSIIEPFSGGEKARLALALIAWQKPNLLLLDEPTNHLDLEMRQALTIALQEFDGAIVLISHDRHLLTDSVDDLYLVAHQKVQAWEGDPKDYFQWIKSSQIQENLKDQNAPAQKPTKGKEERQRQAQIRQKLAPLKKEQNNIEIQLHKAQTDLDAVTADLAKNSIYEAENKNKLNQLLQKRGQYQEQVSQLEEQWLDLEMQIEQSASEA